MRCRRCSGCRGQVVPLVAALLVLAGVVGVGLVHVAAAASRRAGAEASAEAAALAGAAEGRAAAAAVARANDARLVSYREVELDVVVTVERRGTRASARARWSAIVDAGEAEGGGRGPAPWPSDGGASCPIPYTRGRAC